jgi:hypothetical protein
LYFFPKLYCRRFAVCCAKTQYTTPNTWTMKQHQFSCYVDNKLHVIPDTCIIASPKSYCYCDLHNVSKVDRKTKPQETFLESNVTRFQNLKIFRFSLMSAWQKTSLNEVRKNLMRHRWENLQIRKVFSKVSLRTGLNDVRELYFEKGMRWEGVSGWVLSLHFECAFVLEGVGVSSLRQVFPHLSLHMPFASHKRPNLVLNNTFNIHITLRGSL